MPGMTGGALPFRADNILLLIMDFWGLDLLNAFETETGESARLPLELDAVMEVFGGEYGFGNEGWLLDVGVQGAVALVGEPFEPRLSLTFLPDCKND